VNTPANDDLSQSGSLDPQRWIDEHGDYLYSIAFLRLRDAGASEDAVQETFLSALKARDQFAGRSSVRTWLVSILKNKIIDILRKRFREAEITREEEVADDQLDGFNHEGQWVGHWAPGWRPVEWADDPSRLLEKKEFWRVLGECLAKLPTRMSTVFVLYEIEEQPSEDICKELGISSSNLWVLLHRARHQLRLCLEKDWIETQKQGQK
jgi:RNA polymerase sigma-70 factor (ECF subfamily)